MSTYLLIKYAHLLAFVYWLGGDLGTFLASRQVVNSSNSPEARSVALKIMLACDMGPKLAMPIILPLGMQLIAPHFEERRLLELAHAYQHATDWHTRQPEIAQ